MQKFDVEMFKNKFCKSDEQIAKVNADLKSNIESFYEHYLNIMKPKLDDCRVELISNYFEDLYKLPHINSYKVRVKEPYHFIDKLVRKVHNEDIYKNITLDNYHLYFEDLIGFRLILLYNEDWYEVHKKIIEKFEFKEKNFLNKNMREDIVNNNFIISKPEINIRNGDYENIYTSKYNGNEFKLKKGRYYRSIHYSIFHNGFCFEIQLRSAFDEAWGEIDHDILYPSKLENDYFIEYSKLLNRVSGISNEMSSYFKNVISPAFVDTCQPTLRSVPNEMNSINNSLNEKNHTVSHKMANTPKDLLNETVKGY